MLAHGAALGDYALVAARRVEIERTPFTLVLAGGVVRVLGPLLLPALMQAEIVVSGACWAAAFTVYAWRYAPSLWRVRADGQPG